MSFASKTFCYLLLCLLACSCTAHLFSTAPMPDRNRPIARIETRGGIEYGATTREGILFLGRTAQAGPCRVYYWLGPTLVVEDGYIEPAGSILYNAKIDLQTNNIHVLPRDLMQADRIFAMVFSPEGVSEVPVKLAQGENFAGDILENPGQPLPPGAGLFLRDERQKLLFVGLVSAEINIGSDKYVAFAGTDRMREALMVPKLYPEVPEPKYRPDGISIVR